jgi:hypothetical protein
MLKKLHPRDFGCYKNRDTWIHACYFIQFLYQEQLDNPWVKVGSDGWNGGIQKVHHVIIGRYGNNIGFILFYNVLYNVRPPR